MSLLEKIEEVAKRVGGSFEDEYSGRGMYGETCCAVYCDDANQALEEAGALGLRNAQVDHMGKGWVVYWPPIRKKV